MINLWCGSYSFALPLKNIHCKKFKCGIFRLYTIGWKNDDNQYLGVYKIDSVPALKTANFHLYKVIRVG